MVALKVVNDHSKERGHILDMINIYLPCALLLAALGFNLELPGVSGLYGAHRWLVVLVCAAVVVASPVRPVASRKPTFLLLIAMLAIGVLSSLRAGEPPVAWAGLFAEIGLFVLVWRIAIFQSDERNQAITLWQWAAVVGALVYTVRFSGAVAAAIPRGHLDAGTAFLGFLNVRHFAQLTPLLLPVILACALQHKHNFRRYGLALFAGLCWWLLIWLNGNSGAFYAIWIGLGVALLVSGWRAARSLVVLTVGLCGVAFALIWCADHFTPLLSSVQASAVDTGLSGRGLIWKGAVDLIVQHPWLGWGAGQYPTLWHTVGHPHNALLELGVDHGLLAVGLMLALLWRLISPWRLAGVIRLQSGTMQMQSTALVAAVFGGLAHSMVSGVTVMPLSQLTLAVSFGLLLAQTTPIGPESSVPIGVAGRIVSVLFASILLACVLWSYTSICTHVYTDPGACRVAPAFWGLYKN